MSQLVNYRPSDDDYAKDRYIDPDRFEISQENFTAESQKQDLVAYGTGDTQETEYATDSDGFVGT